MTLVAATLRPPLGEQESVTVSSMQCPSMLGEVMVLWTKVPGQKLCLHRMIDELKLQ